MNFTTKQRKFIGISKEKIKMSVKSHLVCVIKNTQNNTKCMKLHTECKSCLTMDRCKNDIFCKYVLHKLCRPHTFVYSQKSPHVVQITQGYTLMFCIICTVWYYTKYVKLLHSTLLHFCVQYGKIHTGQKNWFTDIEHPDNEHRDIRHPDIEHPDIEHLWTLSIHGH